MYKAQDAGQVAQIPAGTDRVLKDLGDIPKAENVTCSRKKLKKFVQAKQANLKVERLVHKHRLAELTRVAWSALTKNPSLSESPAQSLMIGNDAAKAVVFCSLQPAMAEGNSETAGTGASIHGKNRIQGGDDSRDAHGHNTPDFLRAEQELLELWPRYLSYTSQHRVL